MEFKKVIFSLLFVVASFSMFSQRKPSAKELEKIAKENGVSSSEIEKIKNGTSSQSNQIKKEVKDTSNITRAKSFGHQGDSISQGDSVSVNENGNSLFGFDFFSNNNISFTPNLNLATPENYQLGPGDELLIDIWGAAENNYNAPVNREGKIKLENVGPIYVSGLTIKDAKEKIISSLKKIYYGINASSNSYNRVNVDVSLVNVRTVQVNIIGEVKVPGTYSLSALSSVLNGLYAAGGPTKNGTFRAIKVFRGGKLLSEFDIYKYLIEGSQKGNVLLRDQDIIIVSPYKNKVIVTGSVKRSGEYELKEGEDFSDLLRYFGGFNSKAYKDIINVERIYNGKKEINEINYKLNKNYVLNDGDILTVGSIIDEYANRVEIEGAVYRPGNYELKNNLTLKELISKAGLKNNAFMKRGLIYRNINLSKLEVIPFSLTKILDGTNKINLMNNDKVLLFNQEDLKEKYTVSIGGAVNNPQTLDYVENMRVEDLIALAGGFKDGADVNAIDISRRVNDGNFITISKNIKRSASGELSIEENDAFYLQPFDVVSVRYLKGFTVLRLAEVKGEVYYPGSYSITNKEERISDLLEKAGGFSPYAYLKGATLIRLASEINDFEFSELITEYTAHIDSSLVKDVKKERYSIGIDLNKILKEKKSKYDLILKNGDVLFLPTKKETVEIRGEVLAPSVVRYDKSKSLKEYINSSGGFSENARKSKAYAVYPNGEIKSTKRFLFFFKCYPKLEPGAVIVVPNREEKNPLSIQEVIGITTGITTLGILINTLVK